MPTVVIEIWTGCWQYPNGHELVKSVCIIELMQLIRSLKPLISWMTHEQVLFEHCSTFVYSKMVLTWEWLSSSRIFCTFQVISVAELYIQWREGNTFSYNMIYHCSQIKRIYSKPRALSYHAMQSHLQRETNRHTHAPHWNHPNSTDTCPSQS